MPPPPKTPPAILTKEIPKHISTAFDVANLTRKLLRMTRQIEFSLVTTDAMAKPKHSTTPKVDLTADAEYKPS